MKPKMDSREIAGRIRGLIVGRNFEAVSVAAERLNVSESALRRSMDECSPYPALEVLAAIVRECGVEPSWPLFGDYDTDTHAEILGCAGRVPGKDLVLLATSRLYARERELHNRRAAFPARHSSTQLGGPSTATSSFGG